MRLPIPPKTWEPPPPIVLDESELRAETEAVLSRKLDRPVRVVKLSRNPSPFATLFPADVLSVTLDDGSRLSLFVKYLGSEEADHPDKHGPERELFIYGRLLDDPALPVPRYYGSERCASRDRHMLFLEYVDGWSLTYHGIEHWFAAARRLAHLHARFSGNAGRLASCDPLLRLDRDYYRSWAERALYSMQRRDPRKAASLKGVLGGYLDTGIDLLAGQPPTLVHNDLSPKNVIADTSVAPARICFIDWEMAGVGCAFLDLVHLRYGLDEEQAARMTASYLQELDGSVLAPPAGEELGRLLAACDTHKCLYRLAHADSWRLSAGQVRRFLNELDTVAQEPPLPAAAGRSGGRP